MNGSQTLPRPEKTTVSNSSGRAEIIAVAPGLPWHTFFATWLGGVFDGMDSSIFAMVLFPALSDLLHTTSHATVGQYGSYIIAMFMLGWAFGAIYFGRLADKIGRAKTLAITILLYALFTGLCAAAGNWWQLGLCRFLVGAGIGGEMGIGAVLLSEAWPARTRVFALSAQATSLGTGYLCTAGLNYCLGGFGWRYLFIAGIVPAFLTVYMRLKLKDSDHFHEVQDRIAEAQTKGESQRSAADNALLESPFRAIFTPQYLPRTLIVGLVTTCAIVTWWAVLSWIPAWINQMTGTLAVQERSNGMLFKEVGIILSGVAGGFLIHRYGYRKCMIMAFLVSFASVVTMFMGFKTYSSALFPFLFSVGFFANMPFVLLWSYIPLLYPTRFRSTAFGITYNMGRIVAAVAALGSGYLIQVFNGSYALAACSFATIYVVGAIAAMWMVEPSADAI